MVYIASYPGALNSKEIKYTRYKATVYTVSVRVTFGLYAYSYVHLLPTKMAPRQLLLHKQDVVEDYVNETLYCAIAWHRHNRCIYDCAYRSDHLLFIDIHILHLAGTHIKMLVFLQTFPPFVLLSRNDDVPSCVLAVFEPSLLSLHQY